MTNPLLFSLYVSGEYTTSSSSSSSPQSLTHISSKISHRRLTVSDSLARQPTYFRAHRNTYTAKTLCPRVIPIYIKKKKKSKQRNSNETRRAIVVLSRTPFYTIYMYIYPEREREREGNPINTMTKPLSAYYVCIGGQRLPSSSSLRYIYASGFVHIYGYSGSSRA